MKERVVVGAAHHLYTLQGEVMCPLLDCLNNLERTRRGRVGVECFEVYVYAAFVGDTFRCLADLRHHSVTPREVNVAHIRTHEDAARDAVDGSRVHVEDAYSGHGIGAAALFSGAFNLERERRPRRECVLTVRHQHCARVSALPFYGDVQRRRRGDVRHDADGHARILQTRTLFNMEFDKSVVVTFLEHNLFQLSSETDVAPHLVGVLALVVCKRADLFG